MAAAGLSKTVPLTEAHRRTPQGQALRWERVLRRISNVPFEIAPPKDKSRLKHLHSAEEKIVSLMPQREFPLASSARTDLVNAI
jgi:hypothetical protein